MRFDAGPAGRVYSAAPASRKSATPIRTCLRAAKFHGKTSSVMCPICRRTAHVGVLVFGDHLGAVSGSGRTARSWSCWRPDMTSFRYTWWRYAAPAVGITWSAYVLGAVPPPRDRVHTDGARRARTASGIAKGAMTVSQ